VHHRGECVTPKGTLTPSPQGSPHSRRVRIGGRRSVSSDVELADFESDFSAANRDAYHEELSAPKHRRARVSQGSSKPRPRFELDGGNNGSASGSANAAVSALSNQDDNEGGKRRPSYMPTRGLAAVLNQGLATLGEKLGKGSRGNSNEALDMQQYSSSRTKSEGNNPNSNTNPHSHANGNRKKSILKKSESHSSHHSSERGDTKSSSETKRNQIVGKVGSGSKHDPELENLLVSDQESANNTPALARKPISVGAAIVELPPTANHEQIKSLTGPKLRKAETSLKPILVNSSNVSSIKAQPSPPSIQKNNGNVASKEIQTSTISLLALASAVNANQAKEAAANNSNSNGDNSKKFERGRELTDTATSPVFRCPNDMCRHNRPSTALTSTKRKICLCGRTMVSPGGNMLYCSDRIAS
jgi:hypothetical protein